MLGNHLFIKIQIYDYMKKIFSNYRYYILFVLGTIGMLGIIAVPADDLAFAQWLYTLLSSKIIGFGAMYLFAKLVKRWEKKGTIPELIKAINEDF